MTILLFLATFVVTLGAIALWFATLADLIDRRHVEDIRARMQFFAAPALAGGGGTAIYNRDGKEIGRLHD